MTDTPGTTEAAASLARTLGVPTTVGAIEDVDTLYYYDGPLSVLAKLDGVLHYGHLVDKDERLELWMFAPISDATVAAVRANEKPLYDVLTEAAPATLVLYEWDDSFEDRAISAARALPGRDLPTDWLPEPGCKLRPDGWTPATPTAAA